jgi:hypothetical protein
MGKYFNNTASNFDEPESNRAILAPSGTLDGLKGTAGPTTQESRLEKYIRSIKVRIISVKRYNMLHVRRKTVQAAYSVN